MNGQPLAPSVDLFVGKHADHRLIAFGLLSRRHHGSQAWRGLKAAIGCLAFIAGCTADLGSASASPSRYPTGVTIYDPEAAYKSLIVFSAPDGKTHVIDMQGTEIHSWNYEGLPGAIIDPQLVAGERGHVLLQTEMNKDAPAPSILADKTIAELDWSGKVIWSWGDQAPGGSAAQNHDWARRANGNTLLLVARKREVKTLGSKEVSDQGIYEIDPSGKIVWQWWAGDHLAEFGMSAEGMKYLRHALVENPRLARWGYLEINNMQPIGPNKWFDAGDQRFAPDNIIFDSRNADFVAILDKKTGKVVWRIGPDFMAGRYNADSSTGNRTLPRPLDQLAGQHDARIIPKGLPGAGNLLLLDDQGGSGFPPVGLSIYASSRVLEIDPVRQQIVWQYSAVDSGAPPWTFFTSFVGSVQRLPNGNTLIDEGMNGRIFQVTPAGKIVWEYIEPYTEKPSGDSGAIPSRLVYRAQAVPFDWVPADSPAQK